MTNKRLEALAREELTYSTGKPCRRGHNSERYSSNGMCIACVKMQTTATRSVVQVNKAKRNLALAAGLRDHNFLIRGSDVDTMTKVAEILQHGDVLTRDSLTAYVNLVHSTCPNPRALTRDDLANLIPLRLDGTPVDPYAIPQTYDEATGKLLFIFNGHLYMGDHVAEVLQGKRLNVAPTRKQHAIMQDL